MIRFYAPDIEKDHCLPAEESAHCAKVLRRQAGNNIEVVDGCGHVFKCSITDANPRGVKVDILEKRDEPPHWNRNITIAVAPTKNTDRMEWLAEKVTEMGIDRMVLLRTEHSERKEMKTDRLRRVMASAMKQSLKASLPAVEGPVAYKEFLSSLDTDACMLIAHCEDGRPRVPVITSLPKTGQDVVVMIGPEGDFSPSEIEMALNTGFRPVTLGKSRLRTETAAMFAIAALHAADDDGTDCTF